MIGEKEDVVTSTEGIRLADAENEEENLRLHSGSFQSCCNFFRSSH